MSDIEPICRTCGSTTYLLLVNTIPNLKQTLRGPLNLQPLPQLEFICKICIKFIEDLQNFVDKSKQIDAALRSTSTPKNPEKKYKNHLQSLLASDDEEIKAISSIHVPDRHTSPNVACPECGKTFTSASFLRRHKRISCVRSNVFQAQNAAKPNRLSTESKISVDEFKIEVQNEEDEVTDKETSQKDMDLNEAETTLKSALLCKGCGNTYATKSYLVRHQRGYCNRKPSSQVFSEQRSSTPKRGEQCRECDQIFSSSKLLKFHMKDHLPLSHTTCPVCTKVFSHLSNMRRHLRNVHPESKMNPAAMNTSKDGEEEND